MGAPSLRDLVSASAGAHASRLVERAGLLGLPRVRRRALHVGCGLGTTTTALADLFDEVIGVDPSTNDIEDASIIRGDRGNLRFLVGGVARVSALGRFDLIYLELGRIGCRRRDIPATTELLLEHLSLGGLLAVRLALPTDAPLLARVLARRPSVRTVLEAVATNGARTAWSGRDEEGHHLLYTTRAPQLRLLREPARTPHGGGWREHSLPA